jgi:hypothetical protein
MLAPQSARTHMPDGDNTPVTRGRCLCGACTWSFEGEIPDATICNCSACSRYGVLWAYDFDEERIHVVADAGQVTAYCRSKKSPLSFNFCKTCGCLMSWRSLTPEPDGRRRIAVNLRLANAAAVAAIPLLRFDGQHSFEDLPPSGKTVADMWF